MFISRTPYRISFFGGGTDYPSWYLKNGGQVLSTSIDKYLYITCRHLPPFFDHRVRLVYSDIEETQSASELKHPSARSTLDFLRLAHDIEIHYDGDLPSRCGMGSSSAFTVGLLHALYAYKNQPISAYQLAQDSIHIEQEVVGEKVGSQDQVSVAYGGLNLIQFGIDGEIIVRSVGADKDRITRLENHLMLFFTGIFRTAQDVASTYITQIESRKNQLKQISLLVDKAVDILRGSENLDSFGELLHETWMQKRALSSSVSNKTIDNIYSSAREAGALGGKLLGAGAGGMFLLFVPPKKQPAVRDRLHDLIHVPFRFESQGSQIIFAESPHARLRHNESLP